MLQTYSFLPLSSVRISFPQNYLSCHESNDFHCRDYLTKTWYQASDEVVRCPRPACGQDCGFMPLNPLSEGLYLNKNVYDAERLDKLRQQPEVMNNLIGFTQDEVGATLEHIYSLFEDQVPDPIALGGSPGHITQNASNTLQANVSFNPFFMGLLEELIRKADDDTLRTRRRSQYSPAALLHTYAKQNHGIELARWGVDLDDDKTVHTRALQDY